jgi:hypothetical protein
MVSWFRFLHGRWSAYKDQLKPNGNSAATWVWTHESFLAIKTTHEINIGFKAWLKGLRDCPGVLMVVRGKGNSNKGMVDTIHHLKRVKDQKGQAAVIGVDGLSAATLIVGVYANDLFADLSSVKKRTQSAVMKEDWYIPTIKGLIEKRHPVADELPRRFWMSVCRRTRFGSGQIQFSCLFP